MYEGEFYFLVAVGFYILKFIQVTLVRPRDKFENIFRHYLIEDRGVNGSPSYVDYLCYLHKEIRSLLS